MTKEECDDIKKLLDPLTFDAGNVEYLSNTVYPALNKMVDRIVADIKKFKSKNPKRGDK